VNSAYWAFEEIQYLLNQGIAEVLKGNSHCPNENITRAKAARMLVKALKLNINNPEV
jgi:hypothetical protein